MDADARMILASCSGIRLASSRFPPRNTADPEMASPPEAFLSIDIETAGPFPARYALLSVGACPVDDPDDGLYVELKPDKSSFEQSALHVNRLSLEQLQLHGTEPHAAMEALAHWIRKVAPQGTHPIMVAFNAPRAWSFINHYFLEYLGGNPLGRSAIDIRAFYLGLEGCRWDETSMMYLSPRFLRGRDLPTDSLAAARLQAEVFRGLLTVTRTQVPPIH